MLDLKPFCSTKEHVREIREPFPRGEFVYATNGHIMVRVPRQGDMAEVERAPHAEKLFDKTPLLPLSPFPVLTIPPAKKVECANCGGGTESIHDCPDCNCVCTICGGAGEVEVQTTCEVNGAIFDTKYVRLIQTLPGVLFPTSPAKLEGNRFTFEGGEGMLMPCREHAERYVRPDGGVAGLDEDEE